MHTSTTSTLGLPDLRRVLVIAFNWLHLALFLDNYIARLLLLHTLFLFSDSVPSHRGFDSRSVSGLLCWLVYDFSKRMQWVLGHVARAFRNEIVAITQIQYDDIYWAQKWILLKAGSMDMDGSRVDKQLFNNALRRWFLASFPLLPRQWI